MARRGTKKKDLTPEEKLAQALVPEAEWPYQVPGNWCWVRLLESFENQTDSKRKIKQKCYLDSGRIAIVDQGQDLVGGYTNDESMTFVGNLPVIVFGDHTRCIKYIDFAFAQGADGVKVLKPKGFYSPKAFYYALQSVNIPNMGYRRHYPTFKDYCIPVPPIPEQHRIVARIENLFAKLDETKEKAQAVVDGFEERKAAILHQAFTGELTKEWRKKNSEFATTWERIPLCTVCRSIKAGGDKPSDFVKIRDEKHGIPVVANGIDNDGIIGYTAQIKYNGNAVTVSGRGTIGYSIYRRNPFYPVVRLLVIELGDKLIGEYLKYVFDALPEEGTGTSIPQLTVPMIKNKIIPLPTVQEQSEIVRILDSLLDKQQQARDAAAAVLDQIDTMKKAILARAFRGELGTNDPAEESAVELVKSVLEH